MFEFKTFCFLQLYNLGEKDMKGVKVPLNDFKCTIDIQELLETQSDKINFNQSLENFENKLILYALKVSGYNKTNAAEFLSIKRTTLIEKIKRKGLNN